MLDGIASALLDIIIFLTAADNIKWNKIRLDGDVHTAIYRANIELFEGPQSIEFKMFYPLDRNDHFTLSIQEDKQYSPTYTIGAEIVPFKKKNEIVRKALKLESLILGKLRKN